MKTNLGIGEFKPVNDGFSSVSSSYVRYDR